jgi:hypothetical protein
MQTPPAVSLKSFRGHSPNEEIMTHNQTNGYQPVKIISTGWKYLRLEKSRKIPSQQILQELVRIPDPNQQQSEDFLVRTDSHLAHYREGFLPQIFDEDNQKLLQKYSNDLVKELRAEHSSELLAFLKNYCERRGWDFHDYEYWWFYSQYCYRVLILRIKDIPDWKRRNEDLYSVIKECKTNEDLLSARNKPLFDQVYQQSEKRTNELVNQRLKNRFKEFNIAFCRIENLLNMLAGDGESDKYNALVEHRLRRRLGELDRYREKNGVPLSLRQCIFCYRFYEGKGKVSRLCTAESNVNNSLCKAADENWRKLLDRRGTSPEEFGYFLLKNKKKKQSKSRS